MYYEEVRAKARNDLRGSGCNYLDIGCTSQEGEKHGTESGEDNSEIEASPFRVNVVKHNDG